MSAVGTPIKREDIKAGDRIRRSVVSEYTASTDGTPLRADQPYEYELIERPLVLPTEPSSVVVWNPGDTRGVRAAVRRDPQYPQVHGKVWHLQGPSKRGGTYHEYSDAELRIEIGNHKITVARPVAEVVTDVLGKMAARDLSGTGLAADRAVVAAKYGVTL